MMIGGINLPGAVYLNVQLGVFDALHINLLRDGGRAANLNRWFVRKHILDGLRIDAIKLVLRNRYTPGRSWAAILACCDFDWCQNGFVFGFLCDGCYRKYR
jgi:hypothetical protein